MKRGAKIAIAIAVCVVIWLIYALATASAGMTHGGGAIGMIIILTIIGAVWRAIVGKKEDGELTTVKLHTGTGENRYDFEVQMTQEEILQMSNTRGQDIEKWKDNEYELVKTVKPDFRIEELEKRVKESQPLPVQDTIQTIKLVQDGIEASMSLPSSVIAQMELLKKQDPQRWANNEVELVKEAKRQLKATPLNPVVVKSEVPSESEVEADPVIAPVEVKTPEKPASASAVQKQTQTPKEQSPATPPQTAIVPPIPQKEEPKPTERLFGNKLESEYRRESKAESHWIRQDDTEVCIHIEEDVYRKMVELQSENPKKWVNKELDLYNKAKSLLMEQGSPKKSFFRRK